MEYKPADEQFENEPKKDSPASGRNGKKKKPSLLRRVLSHRKTLIAIGVVIILIILIVIKVSHKAASQLVTVTRGNITQDVTVTGNTNSAASVQLSFAASGRIAQTNVIVGSTVGAGQVLAALDTSELQAQLAQAQANVATQQATLANLQVGPQPATLAAAQEDYQSAQQTLANTYEGIPALLNAAYNSANDAVEVQVDPLFSNGNTSNPQLTFTTNNSQAQSDVLQQRVSIESNLNTWSGELASLGTDPTSLGTALTNAQAHLSAVTTFLTTTQTVLAANIDLPPATVDSYKAAINTAQNEVTTAIGNMNTQIQNIATQELAITHAQSEVQVTEEGSTPDQIKAQQAQVASAQASVQSVQAQINQAIIYAPISGTITQQDAKVGQIASPGTPLISIISNGQLDIEAQVAETDIGNVAVGDPVTVSLDAFPNETFTGKVTYIDPGETTVDGVVTFKVTMDFDKQDPRFKSGMTANIDIQTAEHNNVLLLPEYAITENDQGNFVQEYLNSKTTKQVPVTLGIRNADGMIEVTSGVTDGEQVVNIGAAQ